MLSSEIKADGQNCIHVNPGDKIQVNGILSLVFGSTDVGVSYYVESEEKTFFHAGDLNNWHWKSESSPEEIKTAEEDFFKILDEIKAAVSGIDYCFFPVDPRMGEEYYLGAIQFADMLKPKKLIPMHYHGSFNPPDDFYKRLNPSTELQKV